MTSANYCLALLTAAEWVLAGHSVPSRASLPSWQARHRRTGAGYERADKLVTQLWLSSSLLFRENYLTIVNVSEDPERETTEEWTSKCSLSMLPGQMLTPRFLILSLGTLS